MQELFRTLPALFKEIEEPDEIRDAVIAAAWKKIAGNSLSGHTAAVGLNDKTLDVAVRDNIWKRHLESLAGQMIFKINSLLGNAAVTYINFRIDEPAVEKARESERTEAATYPGFEEAAAGQRTDALLSAAKVISDPVLRDLFVDAAANCLARRKLRRLG